MIFEREWCKQNDSLDFKIMNDNLGGWEGEKREGDECFSEALMPIKFINKLSILDNASQRPCRSNHIIKVNVGNGTGIGTWHELFGDDGASEE